jgi:hypothetical protein
MDSALLHIGDGDIPEVYGITPVKPGFIKSQNIGEEDIQRFVANIVMDEETLLRRYGYCSRSNV